MRICAPIHSRKGLCRVAVRGASSPSSRFRYAARSAVKTRPPGRFASQVSATSSVVKLGAVPLDQVEGHHREVEVVVLGHAVDVLGQAGERAPTVPRPAGQHLGREVPRGEPVGERPAVLHLEDLADALAGDLLDRLAEQAAGGAAGPGSEDAVVEVTRDVRDARRSRPGSLDRGQAVGLAGREVRVGRECLELVEELDRQATEAVVPLLTEPGRRGVRLPARLDPAPAYVVDVLALVGARDQLVGQQIGRLHPGQSAHRAGSSPAVTSPARPSSRARARWASFTNTSRATPAMVSPAGVELRAARLGDAVRPVRAHRARPAERPADRAGHAGDRVGVASVVHAAEHRRLVVAVGHEHHAERDRELLDRLGAARPPSVHGRLPIVLADGVERLHGCAKGGDRGAPVVQPGRRLGDRLDRRTGSVAGHGERVPHDRGRGGAGGEGSSHGRR